MVLCYGSCGWELGVEHIFNLGILPLRCMIPWPIEIFVRRCHAKELISKTCSASSHSSLWCHITICEWG